MPPITHVEDTEGNTLHDCEEAGCEVSWDGHERATGAKVKDAPALRAGVDDKGDGRAVVKRG